MLRTLRGKQGLPQTIRRSLMKSIIYIGIDVHKESYTMCSYQVETDEVKYQQKIKSDIKWVLKYVEVMRKNYGENTEFICGYEAGPLGYKLYHELKAYGLECIVIAPTTMGVTNHNRIKTDKNDAANIARCLAFRLYSPVHVPTESDEQVKEYMRMRDDKKQALKKVKQQILALVLRQGYKFTGSKSKWTITHVKWLRSLAMGGLLQETLTEYLVTYDYLTAKLERLDLRIEELASEESYAENVGKLKCLIGVKTYTALSILVETGDFSRFAKADKFASFVGLVPSEDSSGDIQKRGRITKAGNTQTRRLLVESAQSYTRGNMGHKSKELIRRQTGNTVEVIAYADRANERLRRKFYRMVLKNGTARNKAATAVARELACFMWGLMTNNMA
jgi:transposase